MDKLLPCPFCGGEAKIVGGPENWTPTFYDPDSGGDPISVVCKACACGLHFFDDYAEAASAWNRRVDARQLALKTRVCPMCEDCPDGCPVETPKDSRNIVTNADRIRSMNDDEMANWLDNLFNERRDDWKPIGCYNCINYGTHHSDPANKGTRLYECDGCDFEGSQENGYKYGILNWLKQPAKEEHHEDD